MTLSWRKGGSGRFINVEVPELGGKIIAAGQQGSSLGTERQERRLSLWSSGRPAGTPVWASQNRTLPSSPAVATTRPSGR